MAKPNKAQITYKVGDTESVLRFHAVVAEEHEATSEITKFPVQTGFNISNHAIRKNRKVSITGLVTNHVILNSEEGHTYGGNNVRVMFDTLKNLVRNATPCKVSTNFGEYNPVVFTRFKTKLVAGKTDLMEFTMSGEEIQLATTTNGTAPTLLVFTPLTGDERQARVDQLTQAGLDVPDEAKISEAKWDANESCQVETTSTSGEPMLMTYEKTAYDHTTKKHSYMLHTSDTAMADPSAASPTSQMNWYNMMLMDAGEEEAMDIDLAAGASTTSACLLDGLVGLATDYAEGYIDTALGKAKQSIYGAAYGVVGVNGDQGLGQTLLALGVDCLVAGAIGSVDPTLNGDDFQDNSIPTTEQALGGAASIGDTVATDTLSIAAPTTLTKISPPTSGVSFFGDLL